jgi:hypothetical protein
MGKKPRKIRIFRYPRKDIKTEMTGSPASRLKKVRARSKISVADQGGVFARTLL